MKKYVINKERIYNSDWAYAIAEYVVNDMNCEEYSDLDSCIWDNIDSCLIYTDDLWDLLKDYCTPEKADLTYAFEMLFDEVYNLIDEEDEEDEEDDLKDDEDFEKKIDCIAYALLETYPEYYSDVLFNYIRCAVQSTLEDGVDDGLLITIHNHIKANYI